MKTAMQEAIKEIAELWSSPSDTPTYTQIFNVLESKLEIEKQQIVDGCNQNEFEDIDGMGIHETITKGEQYYNETYKKK